MDTTTGSSRSMSGLLNSLTCQLRRALMALQPIHTPCPGSVWFGHPPGVLARRDSLGSQPLVLIGGSMALWLVVLPVYLAIRCEQQIRPPSQGHWCTVPRISGSCRSDWCCIPIHRPGHMPYVYR